MGKRKRKRKKQKTTQAGRTNPQIKAIDQIVSKERSKTIARYPQDLDMQGIRGGKPGERGKTRNTSCWETNGAEEHSSNEVCIMHESLHERYAVCNMGQMQ